MLLTHHICCPFFLPACLDFLRPLFSGPLSSHTRLFGAGRLSLPLEEAAARHDGDGLIHDNLSDGQISRDPGLCRLVFRNLVFPDAGPAISVV